MIAGVPAWRRGCGSPTPLKLLTPRRAPAARRNFPAPSPVREIALRNWGRETIASWTKPCTERFAVNILDPRGPVGARRPHHPDRLAGHHAGDRRADDPRDLRLRLVVPRLEHPRPLPARLGVLRRHRARGLGDPGDGDHPARRRGLDRIARARPGQALVGARGAARDPGRVARLEVALHLSAAKGSRA